MWWRIRSLIDAVKVGIEYNKAVDAVNEVTTPKPRPPGTPWSAGGEVKKCIIGPCTDQRVREEYFCEACLLDVGVENDEKQKQEHGKTY